ncbi:MAG TPA: cysteine dioxygenase [Alcaligenes sp.]|nr:cysteine dioxygenase [Alcaligenes sp.]HRL27712.1 cysteine dioxygenase [Alcaligenes sp.]
MDALMARGALVESDILRQGGALLGALVAQDDWLAPEYAQPHPQFYQQYLLYCCPDQRFSVVSFVWGPGQKTPVHDHTVWGLIGMLRGSEQSRAFSRDARTGHLQPGEVRLLAPGDVQAVSPRVGDIHEVSNSHADRVSISIHVYGADIGRVRRHVFDPQTGSAKEFISGYANTRRA